ncbi:MAG: L-seryl-tRNA(Sec) selenium transferase [Betaproteobacteria bacterium]|nr:L-seryl-tRNA(Sec) selenium transferase [Betaproteobacteria bacterium]
MSETLRQLPSVDKVLAWPEVAPLIARHGRHFATAAIRTLLANIRNELSAGQCEYSQAGFVERLAAEIAARTAPNLKRMLNLTGTVLHTNMGRALLPESAVEHVAMAMRSANNLEFDVESGERGDRDSLVEALLCELTGAEAATVVNNNAAAVLLTIAALGGGKEVIVSRGELVEIGGAFRMPDVMASAGARMVEVGTTNRTHARDFENAITPATGLLMKVHTSNYAIQGFTKAVDESELAAIAKRAGVPFAVDLGSGSLVDLSQFGLPREPLPQDSLAAGVDVVTFSGDKLLGGPQAGLIVGGKTAIQRIKKHPMKRALRVSKIVLAALEATLALYRHPDRLALALPTLRLLSRPEANIRELAEKLLPAVQAAVAPKFSVSIIGVKSQIGSGSLPIDLLPSAGLALKPVQEKGAGTALNALSRALRKLPVPIIGRIADGALILDLRCLEDEAEFLSQLKALSP